jgi:hypothetical protein
MGNKQRVEACRQSQEGKKKVLRSWRTSVRGIKG